MHINDNTEVFFVTRVVVVAFLQYHPPNNAIVNFHSFLARLLYLTIIKPCTETYCTPSTFHQAAIECRSLVS